MFLEIILPIFRSTRLCVTVCGIMHRRCCRPSALIKYIKSVLWRVAKCLSYIEEARCLKVKMPSNESRKNNHVLFCSFHCCEKKNQSTTLIFRKYFNVDNSKQHHELHLSNFGKSSVGITG